MWGTPFASDLEETEKGTKRVTKTSPKVKSQSFDVEFLMNMTRSCDNTTRFKNLLVEYWMRLTTSTRLSWSNVGRIERSIKCEKVAHVRGYTPSCVVVCSSCSIVLLLVPA